MSTPARAERIEYFAPGVVREPWARIIVRLPKIVGADKGVGISTFIAGSLVGTDAVVCELQDGEMLVGNVLAAWLAAYERGDGTYALAKTEPGSEAYVLRIEDSSGRHLTTSVPAYDIEHAEDPRDRLVDAADGLIACFLRQTGVWFRLRRGERFRSVP